MDLNTYKNYSYSDYICAELERNILYNDVINDAIDDALEKQKIKSKFTILKQIFRIKYNKLFY